eukprot:752807-Hanusia_phi.AAC.1
MALQQNTKRDKNSSLVEIHQASFLNSIREKHKIPAMEPHKFLSAATYLRGSRKRSKTNIFQKGEIKGVFVVFQDVIGYAEYMCQVSIQTRQISSTEVVGDTLMISMSNERSSVGKKVGEGRRMSETEDGLIERLGSRVKASYSFQFVSCDCAQSAQAMILSLKNRHYEELEESAEEDSSERRSIDPMQVARLFHFVDEQELADSSTLPELFAVFSIIWWRTRGWGCRADGATGTRRAASSSTSGRRGGLCSTSSAAPSSRAGGTGTSGSSAARASSSGRSATSAPATGEPSP